MGRKARVDRNNKVKAEQMKSVSMMKQEKKQIMKEILKFENSEMKRNRQRKEEVKRQEEEAKAKRERENLEREKKVREAYERKAAQEAAEAKRAEKLVKALEKKEKEWIAKLKDAQMIQESAFGYLEGALTRDSAQAGIDEIRQSLDRPSFKATMGSRR